MRTHCDWSPLRAHPSAAALSMCRKGDHDSELELRLHRQTIFGCSQQAPRERKGGRPLSDLAAAPLAHAVSPGPGTHAGTGGVFLSKFTSRPRDLRRARTVMVPNAVQSKDKRSPVSDRLCSELAEPSPARRSATVRPLCLLVGCSPSRPAALLQISFVGRTTPKRISRLEDTISKQVPTCPVLARQPTQCPGAGEGRPFSPGLI